MSRLPFVTFGTGMLAAPILGMAQGALDTFIRMCQKKIRMLKPGMTEPVSNSAMVQSQVALASAMLDSALELLISSTDAAEQILVNTGAQHITLNWDSISTMYGQHAFGLEPAGMY